MHAQPVHAARGSLAVIASLPLLATFLGGCATVHQVKIDAIRNPGFTSETGHGYRLVSLHSGVESNDPDYPRAVELVRNALAGRGMFDASEYGEVSVFIEVDFGVGPQHMKVTTRNVPPEFQGFEPDEPTLVVRKDGTREIHLGHMTIYAEPMSEKYLSIVARQAPNPGSDASSGVELWRIHVSLESHGDEIADVLPVLVGAAADRLGSDTGGAGKTIRISENAEVVEFVCAGL